MSRRTATLVACLLSVSLVPFSGDGEAADFRLEGPLVMKIGWNSRSLTTGDMDRDGRLDLLVINNDRARIEILYQRGDDHAAPNRPESSRRGWEPILDDAPFDRRNVATGIQLYAVAAGDVDGDGRPDLVYTGNPDRLTVRFQDKDGSFDRKEVVDIDEPVTYVHTLVIHDLDGDGKNEIAALTQSNLAIYAMSESGSLQKKHLFPLTNDSTDFLRAADLNGDGRLDLTYQASERRDRLRVRFGARSGGFGPEHLFHTEEVGGVLTSIDIPGETLPAFVRVQWHTGLVEVLALHEKTRTTSLLDDVRPRTFSTGKSTSKADPSYTVADLDGNGLSDVVWSNPKSASISVILQTSPGLFTEPSQYPALSDIRSLAAGDSDGDGRIEIFMASPKERAVAMSTISDSGRLTFPEPLPVEGKPWAVTSGDLDGDGRDELVYVYEDRGRRGAQVLSPPARKGDPWTAVDLELGELRTGPRGAAILHANHDGRADIVITIPHEPLRLLLQDEAGGFLELAMESGFRSGLVHDVDLSALSTADINGDGHSEIIVAQTGFARAMRVNDDGELEVVDQLNANDSSSEVTSVLVADLDQDGRDEVILAVDDGDRLEVLKRRKDGVFSVEETVELGAHDLVASKVLDLDNNQSPDLLLFGRSALVWLPIDSDDQQLVSLATFETDMDEVNPRLIAVGDLNHDGVDDIVAIDSRDSRVLQILERSEDGRWRRGLHFTVFDVDPHYQGQRGSASEPSEAIAADLDNDGRDDLALLVHDRVLVYYQR